MVGYVKESKEVFLRAASPARRGKGGKLNIFGLMNLSGQLTSYQTSQNVDSQMVIDWLNDFAASIKMLTVVVLDNATPHKSKKFMANIEKWEEQGLFIVYLPTYSPHLNPIEILWRKMKYVENPDASGSGLSHRII